MRFRSNRHRCFHDIKSPQASGRKAFGANLIVISYDEFLNVLQGLTVAHDGILHKNDHKKSNVELCPLGFVSFEFKDGYFEGYSATSSVGPGFHKTVVEFLDSLASALKVRLLVDDETSYWLDRDFVKL